MKRILITGADGQLGSCFSSIFKEKYEILNPSEIEFDITDKNKIDNFIKIYAPEVIINCAAMTDVDGCEDNIESAEQINALSIKNILSNFEGFFLHISTDYVFDGGKGPYKEDDITNPINIYGKTKLLGEEIVRNNSKKWAIIRTNVLFGIESKASFVSWVVNSLALNKPINVVDDQINNPIWINDFAKILDLVIAHDINGLFHIGSNTFCSRYDFAYLIAEVFNLDKNNIHPISTESLKQKAKRPLKSGLISKKLLLKLGIEDIDLKQSLINLRNSI
jgi:dTDP-4-dehydrorhamnose reductase